MVSFYPNPVFFAALLIVLLKENPIRELYSSGAIYTALGDSIAYGIGTPNRYGYVKQFYEYLKLICPSLRLINASRPGITSSGLLRQLKFNSKVRWAVKNAQIITISIGGNNLLKSKSRNYTIINYASAQAGVRSFARDWELIISYMRNCIGAKAPIMVMTLYNPYRCDDPQYATANYFIQQINSIIKNPSLRKTYRYVVVDVYEHFEANVNKDWTYFTNLRRNPHPNGEGHRQIALLHQTSPIM